MKECVTALHGLPDFLDLCFLKVMDFKPPDGQHLCVDVLLCVCVSVSVFGLLTALTLVFITALHENETKFLLYFVLKHLCLLTSLLTTLILFLSCLSLLAFQEHVGHV